MPVKVIHIPAWARRILAFLPTWRETNISGGQRIVKHAHNFWAMYFTFGVEFIETDSGLHRLPDAAVVIVPPRQVHGWVASVQSSYSVVGHFHRGHRAHEIEPAKAHAM